MRECMHPGRTVRIQDRGLEAKYRIDSHSPQGRIIDVSVDTQTTSGQLQIPH